MSTFHSTEDLANLQVAMNEEASHFHVLSEYGHTVEGVLEEPESQVISPDEAAIIIKQNAVSAQLRNDQMSPVLHLSDDILSEILLHLVDPPAIESDSDFRRHYEYLATARLVCMRWYHISVATSRLWSQIRNTIGPTPDASLAMVIRFLTRSKNAPLHMAISVDIANISTFVALLKILLIQHHHSWETISCSYMVINDPLSISLMERVFTWTFLCEFPRLNPYRLHKFINNRDFEGERVDILNRLELFGNSAVPQLKYVDILPMTISWDSVLLSGLVLPRIKAWDGQRVLTRDQYLRVLSSCPGLEELFIQGYHHVDEGMGESMESIITASHFQNFKRCHSNTSILQPPGRFSSLYKLI
ncbi:hypothetical protein FRC03_004044 [Tulasnella sp. 419]|nr:hypothetical protein FRC03_004044 [Tulasnella sp. 419]